MEGGKDEEREDGGRQGTLQLWVLAFNKFGSSTKLFPGSSGGKTSAYNAGDLGSIPGSGRSP